jgi:hypothetical protein
VLAVAELARVTQMRSRPPTEAEVESQALAGLVEAAMRGTGLRGGPSTDPVVVARRLVESERVHVDVGGRLSTDQVVELALRCGRAEMRLPEAGLS